MKPATHDCRERSRPIALAERLKIEKLKRRRDEVERRIVQIEDKDISRFAAEELQFLRENLEYQLPDRE